MYFVLAVPVDVMTQWRENIRKHYPDLLKIIETDDGLQGELKQLESASFSGRTIGRIWVMICNFDFCLF